MKSNLKKKILTALVTGSIATTGFASLAAAEENTMNDFVLDTVVVTASRIPTTITDAKADISLVSREEIEAMHMENVEEALRTVPGVQFLNYGANGANANLSGIRINGSKDIVVLVDGVRVTDFQGSGASGYMYASILNNMNNIERIEVLRGSAATVYGSGAKGGVINIITRKIDNSSSSIDISQGTFGKEEYKFNTQGRRNKVSYNAYYGKTLEGDAEDGDGNDILGSTNTRNSGTKFVYDFDDKHKLTFNYDEIDSRYNGRDVIYANSYNGSYESESFSLRHDYAISDELSNNLTYRENDVISKYGQVYDDTTKLDYAFITDNSYRFISDQVTYTPSRHVIVLGFDYSENKDHIDRRVGTSADGDVIMGKHSIENFSYYIQDDWEVIPKVTLSGGVRYDKPKDKYDDNMPSHTSKSYKLSYDITENDSIYAGRSDFYILPEVGQLFSNLGDGVEEGTKLKPAEGRTTSIGYNKTFDDRNILTVNWFETKSGTTIGLVTDPETNRGVWKNFNNAIDRGWNAQFMSQIGDNWNINVGWAHLFHDAKGDNYSMGYYPKDMATFGIYYNYEKFDAGFTGFYYMRKVNPDYAHVKGWPANDYGIYNLSLNYKPTENLKVYAKIDNIFDKLWAEHTNVVHGGPAGSWYSMPGRSFILGMELKF